MSPPTAVTDTNALDYALGYIERGIHVFPVHYPRDGRCSCGDPKCGNVAKHPYARLAPHGLKSATTDRSTVEKWWRGAPFNVGIRTGAVSGLVALDIDPRHDGDESLARLERQHGSLPRTWRFLTGGGGEHVLFRYPGPLRNTAGILGDGLDTRADGGYIVAPPSQHMSGRRYEISVDHHPDDVPLADMPVWLRDRLVERPKEQAVVLPEAWRKLVAEGVREGRRNDAVARLSGHLLRRGIDPYVALDLVRVWNGVRCKPPLSDAEVLHTVNSIAERETARREQRHDF